MEKNKRNLGMLLAPLFSGVYMAGAFIKPEAVPVLGLILQMLSLPLACFFMAKYSKSLIASLVPPIVLTVIAIVLCFTVGGNELAPVFLFFALASSVLISIGINKNSEKILYKTLLLGGIHLALSGIISLLHITMGDVISMKLLMLVLIIYLVIYGIYSMLVNGSVLFSLVAFFSVQALLFFLLSFVANVFSSEYYADSNFLRLTLIFPLIYYVGVIVISLLTSYIKKKILEKKQSGF